MTNINLRGLRVFALFLALFLSGCSTVKSWLPEEHPVTVSQSTDTTTEATREAALNRFREKALPLEGQHRQWINALQSAANQQQKQTITDIGERINQSATQPSLLFFALGQAWHSVGESGLAIDSWQRAIAINADNYFALNALAMAARESGDFEQAKSHYNQAIAAWPDFAAGYRNRGILFDLYVGDKVAALSDYIRYKQLLDEQGQPTQQVDRWIKEMQRAIQ